MRAPAPGGVVEHSGGWWAASAAQATRRKKSTSFWSSTSIPITSAASRRRTESGSFPMPMFTSPRPKATFGCRRKSLLRRRRMRSRSSRVRKPSQRRTSRLVNGTRLVAPSQSSTACNSSRWLVIPRDIPAMSFRRRDKRSCFGATSSMHSASSSNVPRSQWFSTSTRLRLQRHGINCFLGSRARMFGSRSRIRRHFPAWVACTRRVEGIAGLQWYLPINGTRGSKATITTADDARASVSPLPDAGQRTGNATYRLRIAWSLQDVLRGYRLEYSQVARHQSTNDREWLTGDEIMGNEGIYVALGLKVWKTQIERADKLFGSLASEEVLREIAPGRNRLLYLWGHLTAIHDAMLPLLGLRERLHPEFDVAFVSNPDKSRADIPSHEEVHRAWNVVNAELWNGFEKMSWSDWVQRHSAVSEEDFAKDASRNRFSILLSRTNHLSYHLGQAVLALK